MKISRTVVVVAVLVAAAVGVGLAGMAALAGTQSSSVKVTEVEYKLTLSPTHLSAGKTTLMVVNKGKLAHSLQISGPGLKKRLITGTIKPGTSRSLSVVLKSGSYALWCPVPGHAALGMKTTLRVGSASTGGSGATTTTKSAWG